MTQEDIIEMARYADREWDCDRDMVEWLETFAQAVAARENERLAKVFDARDTGTGFYESHEPAQIIRGEA